ncbi:hypothetical protein TARUN_4543 [Trichoderma arundinaceum]|uniref:NACHT domain-containing protein n=1 Tax=Trichoderma arundinaceum TaxID=490622 RepID=A0A395NP30_TRIAR|nr:hypothetical protein TARUN_4543 [Trichoderma arundinaceum]
MPPRSFRVSLKEKLWPRGRESANQTNTPEQSDTRVKQRPLLAPPNVSVISSLSLRSLGRDRFSRDRLPRIRSASEARSEAIAESVQTNDASVPPSTPDSIADETLIESSIGTETPVNEANAKVNASQPEHLWDEAYDKLKDSHPKLMQLYETILSRRLLDYNLNPSEDAEGDDQIEQSAVDRRRGQMRRLIQAGQQKVHKESKIKGGVRDVMGIILPIKNMISSAIQGVPQAALPWAVVCMSLEILQSPLNELEANASGVRYVAKRMEWYWGIAAHVLKSTNEDQLLDANSSLKLQLVELYQELLLFQIKSVCSYYRNRGLWLLRDVVKLDDWAHHIKNIRKLEAEFARDFGDYMSQQQTTTGLKMTSYLEMLVAFQAEMKESYMEQQDQQCLRDLRITNPRHDRKRIMDAKGGLLWDSYRWILENPHFQQWRDNGESRLLWIKGDPGKGKTMLLCGILNELEDSTPFMPCLSYFFCQGTDHRLNNANAILRGLIYMLIIQRPSLFSYVHREYKDSGSKRLFDDINAWVTLSDIFENILQDPGSKNCCVIIDALDECAVDRKKLLDIIVRNVSSAPHIKWIVSSRNFDDIKNKLGACPSSLRLGLEVNAATVSEAVASYIHYQVPRLGLLKNNKQLQKAMCAEMLEKANGTFLWAALVFKELQKLEDSIAEEDSDMLGILKSIPSDLTDLYHRMMDQISQLSDTPFKDRTRCLAILSAMALAYQPIQMVELPALIGFKDKTPRLENVAKLVRKCGSFLTIRDGTVYFIHQSAKDYLVDAGYDRLFKYGYAVVHRELFSRSLDAMSSNASLRRNMYSLSHPGVVLHEITLPDPDPLANIRYSFDIVEGVEQIHEFFKCYLLNWLEALSLMKRMQSGIVSFQTLLGLLQEKSQDYQGFGFLEDANRFILYNRLTIEEAPLQTYVSALMFSPMKSLVRLHFEKELSWVKTLPIVDEYWSPCIRTLPDDHRVTEFDLSSDAKLIATVSNHNTVKVWDVATGGILHTMQVEQRTGVSVMSSGDSILLLLSSPLRLWDVTMDRQVWSTQRVYTEHVDCRFSSDARRVAAIYVKHVEILDMMTGKEIRRFRSDSRFRECSQLSNDFSLLAQASLYDGIIDITHTATGERRHTLSFSCYKSPLMVFSKDSRFFAFQLDDVTISVRDCITFDEVQTLKGLKCYSQMGFEGNDKLLLCYEAQIDILDVTTGELRQISVSYERVASMALSNDARLIAISFNLFSGLTTIRSTDTGEVVHTLVHQDDPDKDTNGMSRMMAFSGSSQLLAAAYRVHKQPHISVSLWSTDTGKEMRKLLHIGDVTDRRSSLFPLLAFSRDATLLATTATVGTAVRVWDTETGKQKCALTSTISKSSQLAFSYDSQFLARRGTRKIDIWNLESQKLIKTIKTESDITDAFFDNFTLCMALDSGNVVFERLDCIEQPCTIHPQHVATQILNERYVVNPDHPSICWNAKKLIWLPMGYRPVVSPGTATFASAVSVVKIGTEFRGLLTIEFQRPRPVEAEGWTPWQSSLLFGGKSVDTDCV